MKKKFFHANTSFYRKRLKGMIITVVAPLFAICVFCTAYIILKVCSLSWNKTIPVLPVFIIMASVFLGIIFVFCACYLTRKYIVRHNKYTYLDIFPKGMVYSVYAGEYFGFGDRVIYRRLYYMPFSGMEEIIRDGKNSPFSMTIKGEIRVFLYPSKDLGYHIDEDGELSFDHIELNTRGFEKTDKLEIVGILGKTARPVYIAKKFLKDYREAPQKEPFDISKYITKKRAVKHKTSNPGLETPSYSRRW